VQNTAFFRLDSDDSSWIFHCGSGLPSSLYLGPKLAFDGGAEHLLSLGNEPRPPGVLNTAPAGNILSETVFPGVP
jgi:hypothetical protein